MPEPDSLLLVAEMGEFATFSAAEQRYVRRSLDIGLGRADAVRRWSRNPEEAANISEQRRLYRLLDAVRGSIPEDLTLEATAMMLAPLVAISAFDLGQGKLSSFSPYRFLYERLIGAAVRPWLASAFSAAAALPYLHPELRLSLLASLTMADASPAGWSNREPIFYPDWIEKVPVTVS